jgi:hypothetical protein
MTHTILTISISVTLIGCGQVRDDVAPDTTLPRRCTADQPFDAPIHVTELSTSARETDVRLTRDELSAYVTRGDPSNGSAPSTSAIFLAHRDDPTVAFGAPAAMQLAGGPATDAMESADGLSLYVTLPLLPAPGEAIARLAVAHRNTVSEAFGAPVELALDQTDPHGVDQHPYILPSGVLWFSSNRAGSPVGDLWRAEPSGLGFAAPELVAGVSTEVSEVYPVVSDDELTVYFAREVGGQLDIMVATRASRDLGFDAPRPVDELNTGFGDRPGWLSPDGCRLYYTSARDGGAGLFDVWEAEKPSSS